MKNKGNLYILITAFLWSLGAVFIKVIPLNALAINGLRSIVAFIFFVIYDRTYKIKINKYVVAAAICLVLTNSLYVLSNKLTTAANAIVLQYSAPIFVLILQSLYTKTKPSKEKLFVILVAFVGMVVFLFDSLGGGAMVGNIIAILAGLFFAGVFFINSLEGASSTDASKLAFLLSFLVSIPFYTDIKLLTPTSTLSLVALGVFQVGLAYVFFAKGIKLTSAVNSSLISLVEVLFNPLWVFIFVGEIPSLYAVIGGCIVLSAIIINILLDNKNTKNAS